MNDMQCRLLLRTVAVGQRNIPIRCDKMSETENDFLGLSHEVFEATSHVRMLGIWV